MITYKHTYVHAYVLEENPKRKKLHSYVMYMCIHTYIPQTNPKRRQVSNIKNPHKCCLQNECMYVYVYVCMHEEIILHKKTPIDVVCRYVCICICMYACMHEEIIPHKKKTINVVSGMYVFMYVCMYVCVYA